VEDLLGPVTGEKKKKKKKKIDLTAALAPRLATGDGVRAAANDFFFFITLPPRVE